jgi:hypothetical protein
MTPSDDPFHRHEEITIMILKEDLVTVTGSVFRLQIKAESAALAALDTMTTKEETHPEAVSAKSVGRRIGCEDNSGRRRPKVGAGERRRRSGSVERKKKCD